LQLTAQDFNRRLADMPESQRNYILVFYKGSDGFNSSAWVQLIALKYLNTKHLVGIYNQFELGPHSPSESAKKDLESTPNLLICDDGSYSGDQNLTIMHYLWCLTGKEIFVAIPFMTQQSINRISQLKRDLLRAPLPTLASLNEDPILYDKVCKNIRDVKFQICAHQRILTCEELGIKYAKLSQLAPFIFNHKIACNASVPQEIFLNGLTLSSYAKLRFMPKQLHQLSQARRKGKISEDALILSQGKTEDIPFIHDANALPIYKQPATRIKSSL
jgi:hypothetical protein